MIINNDYILTSGMTSLMDPIFLSMSNFTMGNDPPKLA